MADLTPNLPPRYDPVGPMIAFGEFGSVWNAYDTRRQAYVAVKVPRTPVELAARRRPQVRQEAEMLRRIDHPNVVRLLDHGETPTPHLAMELLPGKTLQDQRLPLPMDRVVRVGTQLLSAIDAVHRAGVVHRDIAPRNVMTDATGQAKLMDFGGAAAIDTKHVDVSEFRPATGYTAPELWRRPVDLVAQRGGQRSDLYSVGAMLFQLATGKRLFTTRLDHLRGEVPDLGRLGLPKVFTTLITSLVSRDPADRPRDAAEARDRLGAVVVGAERTAAVAFRPSADIGRPVSADRSGTSAGDRSRVHVTSEHKATPESRSRHSEGGRDR